MLPLRVMAPLLLCLLVVPAAHAEPEKPAKAPAHPVVQAAPRPPVSSAPARPAAAPHGGAHPAKPPHSGKPPAPPAAKAAPARETVKEPAKEAPAKRERDPSKGTVTGLPIPRFVSLRADVVNMRSGPGTRYPIDWVYKRAGMPVEILREFDVWRLVQTPDGEKGWMHEATLVGRRDFILRGERQALRADPNDTARVKAMLEPGVIGRVRACEAGVAWCRVQVGGYTGWLPRIVLWGLLPNEVIKP